MFSAPFDYHRPSTVDEALELLRDVKGARVLAGGHSLLPAMKLRLAAPAALVDVSRIAELSGISAKGKGLRSLDRLTKDANNFIIESRIHLEGMVTTKGIKPEVTVFQKIKNGFNKLIKSKA